MQVIHLQWLYDCISILIYSVFWSFPAKDSKYAYSVMYIETKYM